MKISQQFQTCPLLFIITLKLERITSSKLANNYMKDADIKKGDGLVQNQSPNGKRKEEDGREETKRSGV